MGAPEEPVSYCGSRLQDYMSPRNDDNSVDLTKHFRKLMNHCEVLAGRIMRNSDNGREILKVHLRRSVQSTRPPGTSLGPCQARGFATEGAFSVARLYCAKHRYRDTFPLNRPSTLVCRIMLTEPR